MEEAVLLKQLGDGGAIAAHAAGDGDLIALGGVVKLDGHILHLEGLVGHAEAGADKLCEVGVHVHRGDEQLLGIGVGVVAVETALRLLDAVHTAPDRSLAEGQVVDVLDALKRHRVEQHQTFQLVLVFLLLGRIVKQFCHGVHACVQHGQHADEHQHRDDQPEGLPTTAAVEPGVFFRGHFYLHMVIVSCVVSLFR